MYFLLKMGMSFKRHRYVIVYQAGYILSACSLALQVKLEAVPTFISVLGLFDVEYRRPSADFGRVQPGGRPFSCSQGAVFCGQDNGCLQRWEHLHRQKWTGEYLRDDGEIHGIHGGEDLLEDHCDCQWFIVSRIRCWRDRYCQVFWGSKGPT